MYIILIQMSVEIKSLEHFTLYCERITGVVLLSASLVAVITWCSRIAVCPAVPLKPVDGLSDQPFYFVACFINCQSMMSGVNGQWLFGVSRVTLS